MLKLFLHGGDFHVDEATSRLSRRTRVPIARSTFEFTYLQTVMTLGAMYCQLATFADAILRGAEVVALPPVTSLSLGSGSTP